MAKAAEKPKHTPSAKLALEDVLKSLQDLIRNDLPDAPTAPGPKSAQTRPDAVTGSGTVAPPPTANEVIRELESGLAELTLPSAAEAELPSPDTTLQITYPETEEPDAPSPSGFLQDATPVDAEIAALPEVTQAQEPAALSASEFLQDGPPATIELTALDNVALDFSDSTSAPTIEWDQHLSSAPQNTAAPEEGLPWHAPELSLPAVDLPAEATAPSALVEIGTDPTATIEAPAPAAPADRVTDPKAQQASVKTPDPLPPGGLQAELPLSEPMPNAPAAKNRLALAVENTPVPPPTSPTIQIDSAAGRSSATHENPANWDDIPVLQDAIDVSDTPAAPKLSPAAAQAHRMAIQIAARLNVELRRTGKRALGSDVVTRLARIVQETLAQSAPNVDNKPHNKD